MKSHLYIVSLNQGASLTVSGDDCACPVAYSRQQHTQQATVQTVLPTALTNSSTDDHCACPSAPSALLNRPNGAWLQTVPALDTALPGSYRTLHCPETGGTAVLNKAALQFWQAFRTPQTPEQAAAQLALSQGEAHNACMQLWQAGLLRPAEATVCYASERGLLAWLHLTDDCTLACTYCYAPRHARQMDERTGLTAIERLFNTAQRYAYPEVWLKYAGGEPLLRFDLLRTMQTHARQLAATHGIRLHSTVLTNGTALTPAMAASLRALDVGVGLSLDGLDEAQEAQRPLHSGASSIRAALRALEIARAEGLHPHLNITVTAQSAPGLANLLRFALEQGLTFHLNFYRPATEPHPELDLNQHPDEVLDGLRAALAVIEQNLPPWSLLNGLLDLANFTAPHARPCGSGHNYLVIGPQGQISRCQMQMQETVSNISAADPLAELRSLSTPAALRPECEACPWRYACAGGCPHLAGAHCTLYKALFPELLRLEGLRVLQYSQ